MPLRQNSSKNILDLSYAKAVEKKASLNASVNAEVRIPSGEEFKRIEEVLAEIARPITPSPSALRVGNFRED